MNLQFIVIVLFGLDQITLGAEAPSTSTSNSKTKQDNSKNSEKKREIKNDGFIFQEDEIDPTGISYVNSLLEMTSDVSELSGPDKTQFARSIRKHKKVKVDKRYRDQSPGEPNLLKWVKTKVTPTREDEIPCDTQSVGPFRHLYKTSKFFLDNLNRYTYEKAVEACVENGFAVAEFDGLGDHRSFQSYFLRRRHYEVGEKFERDQFFIGMNDKKKEGHFQKASGPNITFQSFFRSQPDDRNMTEDCVVLTQEAIGGPMGMADVDCQNESYALCMFAPGTECYKRSNETVQNYRTHKERTIKLFFTVGSKKSYYVSNFQLTWDEAMEYCESYNLTLFNMDQHVSYQFFDKILKFQQDLVKAPIPTVDYWTSGKMMFTHMNAPIFWQTKSNPDSGEWWTQGTEGAEGGEEATPTWSWSGVYRWSSRKPLDPGGPYWHRKDLCISFGFEGVGDATPTIRNSNCDIPCNFVCTNRTEISKKSVTEDDYEDPERIRTLEKIKSIF